MSYTIDDIKAHANGRWNIILPSLGVPEQYLNTRKHQPCPSCGGRDRFRYTDYKGNGGFICNQCSPGGGSGFDLLMLVCDCEFSEALKMVANHLGLTSDSPNITPKPFHAPMQPTITKDNIERIEGYLSGCEPITERSIIGQYLIGRGLDWQAIQELQNLLYRPLLDYWAFSQRDNKPIKLGSYPAMIAKITKGTELMGVHVTYIDGTTKKKLVIEHPETGELLPIKKMQTRYPSALTGASIQLYQPHNGQLAVCEGIETALAVKQMFSVPCWACGSAENLKAIELPTNLETLFIVTDNDESETGQRVSRDLSNRAILAGVTVKQWTPPTIGHDALDELNRQNKGS